MWAPQRDRGVGLIPVPDGGYRVTGTQQIDFRVGIGLNRNAPAYIFGTGYSFRIDRLFR